MFTEETLFKMNTDELHLLTQVAEVQEIYGSETLINNIK